EVCVTERTARTASVTYISEAQKVGIFVSEEASHFRRHDAGSTVATQRAFEEYILRSVEPISVQSDIRNAAARQTQECLVARSAPECAETAGATAIVRAAAIGAARPRNFRHEVGVAVETESDTARAHDIRIGSRILHRDRVAATCCRALITGSRSQSPALTDHAV